MKNIQLSFTNLNDFQKLNYFISALVDIVDGIAMDEKHNNQNNNNNKNIVYGKMLREIFIGSAVIDLLCAIIYSPFRNFINNLMMNYNNNNHGHYNIDNYREWNQPIKDVQLNSCYILATIMRYDVLIQTYFGKKFIMNMIKQLNTYQLDHVDRSSSQIGITYVLHAACYQPKHVNNIKLLTHSNTEYILNQLFQSTKST